MELNLSKMSFCKKHGMNVNENKDKIIDILNKYDLSIKKNRAAVLNDRSLKFLNNPHLVSVKTTGTNYFLLLTKINNINHAFFIDRKIKQGYTHPRIILVKYGFADEVFEDTVLDGELVKNVDNDWVFLISDMPVYCGKKTEKLITKKLSLINDMLKNKYRPDDFIDICPLQIKKYFSYKDFAKMLTIFIPNLGYNVRGLYFDTLNPKHSNQLFIFPREQSKPQKPKVYNESNIRNFIIRKTMHSEIYDLYDFDDNKDLVKVDTARVPSLKVSKKIKKLFHECSEENVEIKCRLNNKFNKWEPIF